ncbi:unnamed protein product [Acanthoscelides obtectus]|uniref:Uncharacterized protein n=1 Tax=Acanthoscelides obtectus TaxID=200917 RepID=A0A9P0PC54_ACAOB|nr:unnamed protein product [Acanthoscelides obtectus]CAK1669245.1 hypothetical protein AOBTE_LOCUS26894 [Acanthoscelides obtectus]
MLSSIGSPQEYVVELFMILDAWILPVIQQMCEYVMCEYILELLNTSHTMGQTSMSSQFFTHTIVILMFIFRLTRSVHLLQSIQASLYDVGYLSESVQQAVFADGRVIAGVQGETGGGSVNAI